MMSNQKYPLTPEDVTAVMSFEKGNQEWVYDATTDKRSMAHKQAEGVAYLWNLLHEKNTALLADEVGMGKTFQAIGLIMYLNKLLPNIRVLIITPNRNICEHWKTEFNSFSEHHFHNGNIKSESSVLTFSEIENNLINLAKSIEDDTDNKNVYLTTVHAFSGLTKNVPEDNQLDGKIPTKAELASREAKKLNTRIKKALNGQFDLVVIDEAHYFRTVDGGSQKVAAAKSFFGDASNRLAKKVLLMTATPTHSSPFDVSNILSYFCNEESRDAKTLLDKYALRRFRLMRGKDGVHFSKYDYREERQTPVTFKDNPNAELFFGLYQRELVHTLRQNRCGGNQSKRLLYGYLEGFESFGEQNSELEKKDPDEEYVKAPDSFNKAYDSEILKKLSNQYRRVFNQLPEHPKYSALVKTFIPEKLDETSLNNIKHLVFVRRIPSVKELTKRTNEAYDVLFAKKIAKVLDIGLKGKRFKKWKNNNWSREVFNEIQSAGDENFNDPEANENNSSDDEQILTSKIASLFVKRQGEPNTLCTNTLLRFKRPERIFSLFLEPSLDYLEEGYSYYYKDKSTKKSRSIYSTAAQDARKEIESNMEKVDFDCNKGRMRTAWSLIFPLLPLSSQEIIEKWKNRKNSKIMENFSNYLKAGFLFASPVSIELFIWYHEFEKTAGSSGGAETRYRDFLNDIERKNKLKDSWLLWYFNAAVSTFEDMCEKIEGIKLDDDDFKWNVLKTLTSPAMFASGMSKNRQRLITGFNSPFYPNVLVATSVFKEGVNLHLQCNQVHHYGLAGNPGDNEQRVGRLDRLFGKVNRTLEEKGSDARLKINYPYLEQSFDEDQLASFLERKFLAEEKLDACLEIDANNEIDDKKADNWHNFLNKPNRRNELQDPYPPK